MGWNLKEMLSPVVLSWKNKTQPNSWWHSFSLSLSLSLSHSLCLSASLSLYFLSPSWFLRFSVVFTLFDIKMPVVAKFNLVNKIIMIVSVYYKLSLFNAHAMILFVYIYINVNKLCLNQRRPKARERWRVGCMTVVTFQSIQLPDLRQAKPA